MTAHTLTPTILRDRSGEPAFAVVPWVDWLKLLEETRKNDDDEAAFATARAADDGFRLPFAQTRRIVAGDNVIKVLREWRGLDQTALAERIGSRPNYVSQLETGARRGVRQVRALALALETPVEVLRAYL